MGISAREQGEMGKEMGASTLSKASMEAVLEKPGDFETVATIHLLRKNGRIFVNWTADEEQVRVIVERMLKGAGL